MKKAYLKTPNEMYDFIYNWWFIYNGYYMMGMEENPLNIQKNTNTKTKEKFPVWLPSHPPVDKNGGRLFSGVRKQARLTLGWTGVLV